MGTPPTTTAAPATAAPTTATTTAQATVTTTAAAMAANCKLGYEVPSILNLLEDKVEPMTHPTYGGSCSRGKEVAPCFEPEQLKDLNTKCSLAMLEISKMKNDKEYAKRKLKKCKRQLELNVLCLAGNPACQAAHPGDWKDKAITIVEDNVVGKGQQDKAAFREPVGACLAST